MLSTGNAGKPGDNAPCRDTLRRALTYCTNIHPGESWREIFAALRHHAPLVKQAVAPEQAFPLGLRLSASAARQAGWREAEKFRTWCAEQHMYVASINGFPYGTFHDTPIKEGVYLPDWRFRERLDYTRKLADLLALWLPPGRRGSISTVPVGYRSAITSADMVVVRRHVEEALDYLDYLAQESGSDIVLSMEPEPGCVLETTADVVELFDRLVPSPRRRRRLALCYDCCHQALQFEDPRESLALLARHEITIGHVQVSSALRLAGAEIARLQDFVEPFYLHQTVGRTKDGNLLRFADLSRAIAAAPPEVEEWRVHFHVPVFLEDAGVCGSTRFFLEEILPLFPADVGLEVETYTWTILPPALQGGSVTDCLIREIEWVAGVLGRTS